MTDESLHELADAAQKGDLEAFSEIVARMQQPLFRYCFPMLGNRQDAEDTVQEVFVRAYANLHKYRENRNFTGWLFTIAHRLCLNRLKKRSRWRMLLAKAANEEAERSGNVEPAEEEGLSLLASLQPKQRELIVLKVLHEMSYEEISEIVGVPAINLRKQFERTRRKLQREHPNQMKRGITYEH
ncbi:RNA polymerase sigma factor [Cohnella hongkongensis]|uniref:RNA polymerase sigma factor n=1 Tax=Cohnella hongkongensis TaxID=178337 RepID=A0ABV9FCU5_9BACL